MNIQKRVFNFITTIDTTHSRVLAGERERAREKRVQCQ
jgi:hypothetical protein